VEPAALLGGAPADEDGAAACALHDGGGRVLARPPRRPAMPEARQVHAQRPVKADNWSPAGPWALRCAQAEGSLLRLAEPVAARYRATLALNVALMALALLLGGFAVQQLRRRERLESAAREEARVRELERQLFHAERLKTVGRLAAGIAHEINNPLEGMANYLALAREALERGETADGGRHLASVKEGLERAAAVVRQVLAHADPDKAPLVPCDLNQVLRDIGRFVETRRDFAAIDFTFDLPAEPLLVHGSPVMLGQVAVNLVLNACEAQPRGGEVRISSHRENGSAVAEFADRGPGVPEPDRQRIFEPFYSTKDTTGLGLSICHSIVRQHEGELSVHPRAGGGALFRMRLPALEG
jgi:signal transduction histidine kinase